MAEAAAAAGGLIMEPLGSSAEPTAPATPAADADKLYGASPALSASAAGTTRENVPPLGTPAARALTPGADGSAAITPGSAPPSPRQDTSSFQTSAVGSTPRMPSLRSVG